MNRPRLLDLFSGAGGAAVGYHRAGFDVVGVDIEPHDDYPYELIVADAVAFLERLVAGGTWEWTGLGVFDVIHASPPCPRYSRATAERHRDNHPDLLGPVLDALRSWGGTWVVENVPGAPLPDPVMVCGRAMGLRWTRRHRLFASSVPLFSPGCACGSESPYGVTGDGPEIRDYARNGRKARSVQHAGEVMGIDWMTRWDDLADAIPPVMTEFIGSQLLDHLAADREAVTAP